LTLEDGNFYRPEQLITSTNYLNRCVGQKPGATP
jgi:hypothetical protein